jgi:hypothetical protein
MVTDDRGAPGSQRATGSSMLHWPRWCSSSTSGSVATTLVSEARSNSVSASAGTGSGKSASASLAQPPAAEYGVLSGVHTRTAAAGGKPPLSWPSSSLDTAGYPSAG